MAEPGKDRRSSNGQPYWRFDRDQTLKVSHERGRLPQADAASPVSDLGPHTAGARPPPDTEVPRQSLDPLRRAIDQGQAADKVAYPDPAAAPLGTDDEAAGRPPSAEELRLSREATGARPVEPGPATVGAPDGPAGRGWVIAAVIAGLAMVVVGVLAVSLL